MKRILVTQRVDVHPVHGERRDALDQRWVPLLAAAGAGPVPVPNLVADAASWLEGADGLVLSGGNDVAVTGTADVAPERDAVEARLYRAARAAGLPVLGVCRGAQHVNVLEGGSLARVPGHVATRHAVRAASGADRPSWLPAEREVNSYHAWGIPAAALAPGLAPLALDAAGNVEAFHADAVGGAPVVGVLWHPERESPFHPADLTLLRTLFGGSP